MEGGIALAIMEIGSSLIHDQKFKSHCNRTVKDSPQDNNVLFLLCSFTTKINLCALFVNQFILHQVPTCMCHSKKPPPPNLDEKNVQSKNSQPP